MRATILILLAMLIVGVLGYLAGVRSGVRSVVVTTTERVIYDTIYHERPAPIRVLPPTFASVRVPCLLFAPADRVVMAVIDSSSGASLPLDSSSVASSPRADHSSSLDSVTVRVEIAHKEYGDSTYRAQVSGPRVGAFGPKLDWIKFINQTKQSTTTITPPSRRSRFAVTLGAGVAYTPKGVQPYIGVGAGLILWQR